VTWFLGQLACAVGKSPHVLFGLDLMYEAAALVDDSALYREFIRYSGAYDIFDVLSKAPNLQRNADHPCSSS
jgi:hypothetical protein